jgi:hypothetical protein
VPIARRRPAADGWRFVVDAIVAQAAEQLADSGNRVTVLTTDLTGLPRLGAAARYLGRIAVLRI